MKRIAWCNSHYRTDFTKEKAKELREQGYHVSFGSYVKEEGNSYCKIYLTKDLNYYVLRFMKSVKSEIVIAEKSIQDAIVARKHMLREACMKFSKDVRMEYEHSTKSLVAIVDNDYELKIKI